MSGAVDPFAMSPETAEARARMRLWFGRARAAGALTGFALGMVVCHRAGIPVVDGVLRSLAAAVALSLVSWWSALLVAQALIRTAAVRRDEQISAAMAEAAAARADRWAQEDEEIRRRLRRHRGEPDEPPDGLDADGDRVGAAGDPGVPA